MGRRGYPAEFCRKVRDLVESGRPVADVAKALGIRDQTIYRWRRQDRIDKGLQPGRSSTEKSELEAAKRRIAALEAELALHRRASELLGGWCHQKAVRGHRGDGRRGSVGQLAARVLEVSMSGYYDRKTRAPSARSIRHALLTDAVLDVHTLSRGTYEQLPRRWCIPGGWTVAPSRSPGFFRRRTGRCWWLRHGCTTSATPRSWSTPGFTRWMGEVPRS